MARGWSQSALCNRAGVGRWTLARLEANGSVKVETLEAVAAALGCHPAVLMRPPRRAGRSSEG